MAHRRGGRADTDPRAVERLAAAIWISLALNEAEVHGVERGLASERGRVRAQRIGDPSLLVRVHSQHAFIAIRSGEYAQALGELAIAESMIEHANDNDRFAILINSGLVGLLCGDLPTPGARSSARWRSRARSACRSASSRRCTTWPTWSSWPATCRPRSA